MRALELKIPPLALVLLTAAVTWLSARTAPTFTFVIPLRNSIAVAIALLGAATSILGVVAFRRAGTTVNGTKPDKRPFRSLRWSAYRLRDHDNLRRLSILVPVNFGTENWTHAFARYQGNHWDRSIGTWDRDGCFCGR